MERRLDSGSVARLDGSSSRGSAIEARSLGAAAGIPDLKVSFKVTPDRLLDRKRRSSSLFRECPGEETSVELKRKGFRTTAHFEVTPIDDNMTAISNDVSPFIGFTPVESLFKNGNSSASSHHVPMAANDINEAENRAKKSNEGISVKTEQSWKGPIAPGKTMYMKNSLLPGAAAGRIPNYPMQPPMNRLNWRRNIKSNAVTMPSDAEERKKNEERERKEKEDEVKERKEKKDEERKKEDDEERKTEEDEEMTEGDITEEEMWEEEKEMGEWNGVKEEIPDDEKISDEELNLSDCCGTRRVKIEEGEIDPLEEQKEEMKKIRTDTIDKELVAREMYPHAATYIDSHCHLDFLYEKVPYRMGRFNTFSELRDIFPSAFPSTFGGCIPNFIRPSIYMKYAGWIRTMITSDDVLGTTWGVHPHHANECGERVKKLLSDVITIRDNLKVVAIGECGLDFSKRNGIDKKTQLEVFEYQVDLAVQNDLTLVIHCREGREDPEDDVLRVLTTKTKSRYHPIHRHCFTRNAEVARKWMDALPNCTFGFTPAVITGRDSSETIRSIPLDRIVLETDTPFFKPIEFTRIYDFDYSIPSAAVAVAAYIAKEKGLDIDEVIRVTTMTTERIYQVKANLHN